MRSSLQHHSTSFASRASFLFFWNNYRYKIICCFIIGISIIKSLAAQDSIKTNIQNTSTTFFNPVYKQPIYPYNKTKVKVVGIGSAVGYSAAIAGLYSTWYKDYPQSEFHSFNDIDEWKGMDKIGHVYSAYTVSKVSMEMWRWTGINRKKRIWLGGLSGAMYQTVIEILDGFSSEWGWSWADFGANIIGSGLLISQELAWDEQRIQLKCSFHRKNYTDASLNQRSDDIFGKSSAERFLKDYNGQTYWLSTGLRSFFPHSKIPSWLQISIGTGVEGSFGARENKGVDKNGNIIFYRPDIKRVRQWFLAPDIDLSKIKTKKKGIKIALNILNIVKFPTPSLGYSNGKFNFNWFHF